MIDVGEESRPRSDEVDATNIPTREEAGAANKTPDTRLKKSRRLGRDRTETGAGKIKNAVKIGLGIVLAIALVDSRAAG